MPNFAANLSMLWPELDVYDRFKAAADAGFTRVEIVFLHLLDTRMVTTRTTPLIDINPERLAELEAGGWRAYYDRNWPRLISLMVQLNQEQFHIPFPLSVVAAFHVARGSIAWAPVQNDPEAVRRHFTRFYRMARRWSGMTFEPRRAAELEVGYWIEHRRLLGNPDKSSFIEAMTALHSHLFDLPPERMRESAEWRIKANTTVDLITGGLSHDPKADWAKLEEELRQCYRSIKRELATANRLSS